MVHTSFDIATIYTKTNAIWYLYDIYHFPYEDRTKMKHITYMYCFIERKQSLLFVFL